MVERIQGWIMHWYRWTPGARLVSVRLWPGASAVVVSTVLQSAAGGPVSPRGWLSGATQPAPNWATGVNVWVSPPRDDKCHSHDSHGDPPSPHAAPV